jgi:hypothetical protein
MPAAPAAPAAPAIAAASASPSSPSPPAENAWRYEFPVWCHDIQGTYRVGRQGNARSDRVVLDGTAYTRDQFVEECTARAGIEPPRKKIRPDDAILFQKGKGHSAKRVKLRGNAILREHGGGVQNELREVMDPRVGSRARRGKGVESGEDDDESDEEDESSDDDES